MRFFFIIFFIFTSAISFAQSTEHINWQNADPATDKIYGAGTDECYKTLSGKTAQPVIVAVIDGGTDVTHEDLKNHIWTNTGEIPDNGIDDDHNGYIDDVHGWNFLGGKNGDIVYESTELARIYHKLKKKFDGINGAEIQPQDTADFKQYAQIKPLFLKEQEDQDQLAQLVEVLEDFVNKVKAQNNGQFNRAAVKNYVADNPQDEKLKKRMKLVFLFMNSADLEKELNEGTDEVKKASEYSRLDTDSIRRIIVGDDPDNPAEKFYGNNHIHLSDALHGTHVAGIIAGERNNNIGLNGIADNARIMVLRAVPDGDERDKDVANAIRYAADNGARIINMSFGKYYSPNKKTVDDAIQYAISKDILFVHASGNESKNTETDPSFPNVASKSPNWIEVGASSYKKGKNIIVDFSNYGKTTVDLFAPGEDIYSSVPDNKYAVESGTSMASPVVSGVAALIMGYFPELKPKQVHDLIMQTVSKYSKKVHVPGHKSKARLSDLCISAGIVNADQAVKEQLKKVH
jgi:cell wall-associated protease